MYAGRAERKRVCRGNKTVYDINKVLFQHVSRSRALRSSAIVPEQFPATFRFDEYNNAKGHLATPLAPMLKPRRN